MKRIAYYQDEKLGKVRLEKVPEEKGICSGCFFIGKNCDTFLKANGLCERAVWKKTEA
jgi:hypothetical protein